MHSFSVYRGSQSGMVVNTTTNRPRLSRDQVKIRVTASGLCGTDLHFNKVHMGLGHEGVGIVEELGPDCTVLKKDDRVGWGYQHDSCGRCQYCLGGNETYCLDGSMYGKHDLDQGSMAEAAIWREAFLFKIPESIADEHAAPLMCAGATVFNALHNYGVKPTHTVGVVGIGGLGHLAIQYASKMGCRVIAFSRTDSKKEEAMELGAHDFVALDANDEPKTEHHVNVLLVTTSAQPNWSQVLKFLGPNAFIFPLSIAEGDLNIPYMEFLTGGHSIQASLIASRASQNRMLEFSALHGIKPIIQKFSLSEKGCNEAIAKLAAGGMRYRGVLVRD